MSKAKPNQEAERGEPNQPDDNEHQGWIDDDEQPGGMLIELDSQSISPAALHPGDRIVRTETIHYVRVDGYGKELVESQRRSENLHDSDEGLTPTLIAVGLMFVAALLGFGWYLGTRSAHERATAVAAELPNTERHIDDFGRDDVDELAGETPDGSQWSALGTSFILESGLATISAGNEGEVGIALIDTGWSDGTVGATVATTSAGTGLIFRFVDIFNHWSLIAAPEFGTWNLNLVVEGESIRSESIGLASTEPGARVSILMDGPEIRIFVNGAPTIVIADPTFELATSSGVISVASTGGAFDEYYALHDSTSNAGE